MHTLWDLSHCLTAIPSIDGKVPPAEESCRCCLDTVPRQLAATDCCVLTNVAELVVRQLEKGLHLHLQVRAPAHSSDACTWHPGLIRPAGLGSGIRV